MTNSTKPTGGQGSFEVGSGQSGLTKAGGDLVTPFSKAATSAAARRRREAQQAMKATLQVAWAVETEREEAWKKKMEEEAAAAAEARVARAEIAMDVNALMDLGIDDETEEADAASLGDVVWVLDKEVALLLKKRIRKVEEMSKLSNAVVPAASSLRQSSFIPHNYMYPRVIVERSARLESKDKVAQFIGLIGTLLTNGKMVDWHFVLNPAIIGGARRTYVMQSTFRRTLRLWGGISRFWRRVC
jgi:hypothetical protein